MPNQLEGYYNALAGSNTAGPAPLPWQQSMGVDIYNVLAQAQQWAQDRSTGAQQLAGPFVNWMVDPMMQTAQRAAEGERNVYAVLDSSNPLDWRLKPEAAELALGAIDTATAAKGLPLAGLAGSLKGVKRLRPLYHGVMSEMGTDVTDAGGISPIKNILKEGFTKGESSEIGVPGTSLSYDPLVSLNAFTETPVYTNKHQAEVFGRYSSMNKEELRTAQDDLLARMVGAAGNPDKMMKLNDERNIVERLMWEDDPIPMTDRPLTGNQNQLIAADWMTPKGEVVNMPPDFYAAGATIGPPGSARNKPTFPFMEEELHASRPSSDSTVTPSMFPRQIDPESPEGKRVARMNELGGAVDDKYRSLVSGTWEGPANRTVRDVVRGIENMRAGPEGASRGYPSNALLNMANGMTYEQDQMHRAIKESVTPEDFPRVIEAAEDFQKKYQNVSSGQKRGRSGMKDDADVINLLMDEGGEGVDISQRGDPEFRNQYRDLIKSRERFRDVLHESVFKTRPQY